MNPLLHPQFFHEPTDCREPCCIHNPSPHHMVSWPLNWRQDRAIMERVCPHGIGHPDPDDRAIVTGRDTGVHGCDGCCTPPSPRTGECPACGEPLCPSCGNCRNATGCDLEAPCV